MRKSRELNDDQFADHMRARRGEAPRDSRYIIERGIGTTGEQDWMIWISVSSTHPWYGEQPDECFDELLHESEDADGHEDTKHKGCWLMTIFVADEERGDKLLEWICEAAEAAVARRLGGTVNSSR